jgi:hypothetical protein
VSVGTVAFFADRFFLNPTGAQAASEMQNPFVPMETLLQHIRFGFSPTRKTTRLRRACHYFDGPRPATGVEWKGQRGRFLTAELIYLRPTRIDLIS